MGERKRRWVVAAGLYYGQVKKLYRRHRLVGVAYRERLGAIADIKAKLQDLGSFLIPRHCSTHRSG